jgi:dihydrofolate synthase / folylpolyglutamate synthase
MNLRGHLRYHAAIRYLESFILGTDSYQKTNLVAHRHPEMFLERMQDFLDRIGNPEIGFKYIHITGTAGKGSVSSIVHATLVTNGKTAGLFTSPFTVSTIEKIQVGRKYINPNAVVDIVESLKPHIDAAAISDRYGSPSYFELMFAIALLYFKHEKCEYAVLEVGLGGRYDATNIIKKPLVTAITNIGLDHMQVLGKTAEKIARDKAGIIKKGSHFFTTESNRRLLSIFKGACARVGASYHPCTVHGLDYEQRNKLLAGSMCADLGIIGNLENISMPECIPARFEIVGRRPLVIIDGAHNPSKIKTTVYNLEKQAYRKLFLVIAIAADKDWKTMLEFLLPKTKGIYVTRFAVPGRQCVNPKELMKFAQKYITAPGCVCLRTDPVQAFNHAKGAISKDDALLVTGSFYLAGDIRALYCPEEQILAQRSSKLPVGG